MKALENSGLETLDDLKSRLHITCLYGVAVGILAVIIAALIIGFQMTGEVSLHSMSSAHDGNMGLRFLYLLPFVLAFWGQHSGQTVVYRAGDLIQQRVQEFNVGDRHARFRAYQSRVIDPVTGLPNRLEFFNQLNECIMLADRQDRQLLLFSIDLDNFKDINEVYGNQVGDLLLGCVASRLQNLLQQHDLVSRTGGDEFTILITSCTELPASQIADRIQQAFESPFEVNKQQIAIKGSCGIAIYPEHADSADQLMQKAEQAMHAAKQNHSGCMEYNDHLNADNSRRVTLLASLKTAIENNELSLCYQPKIDLRTKTICSVEALLRWQQADLGFISPGEFIPLAERNRLINPITKWVIRTGMMKMLDWRERGIDIGMCINISTRDLDEPHLPDMVRETLDELDLAAESFTLEITESSIMRDPKQSLGIIRQLSELGLRISIDDFGTGYSSLAYLSKLNVNEIKIDRSFVMGMHERRQDATIVKATIDLAHNLDLCVTAEGIENQQVMQRLDTLGCDIGQGYYFSPPLVEKEMDDWLSESGWNSRTGTFG